MAWTVGQLHAKALVQAELSRSKMSMRELAKKLEVSPVTVSNLLSESQPPGGRVMSKLAAYFKGEAERLLDARVPSSEEASAEAPPTPAPNPYPPPEVTLEETRRWILEAHALRARTVEEYRRLDPQEDPVLIEVAGDQTFISFDPGSELRLVDWIERLRWLLRTHRDDVVRTAAMRQAMRAGS